MCWKDKSRFRVAGAVWSSGLSVSGKPKPTGICPFPAVHKLLFQMLYFDCLT